MLFLFTVAPVL